MLQLTLFYRIFIMNGILFMEEFLWFHVLHSNLFSIAPTHADARRVLLGRSRCERTRTDALLSHSANERWRWGGTEDLMLSVCGLRDWVVERCWNTSLRGCVCVMAPSGWAELECQRRGRVWRKPAKNSCERDGGGRYIVCMWGGKRQSEGGHPERHWEGDFGSGRECMEKKVWETWFCVGTGR